MEGFSLRDTIVEAPLIVQGKPTVSCWGVTAQEGAIFADVESVYLHGFESRKNVRFFRCGRIEWSGGEVHALNGARPRILLQDCPTGEIVHLTGSFEVCQVRNKQEIRVAANGDYRWPL